MMIVALLVTDIPLEVFATNSENSYQSKLDGWTVHAVWNTSSTDYEWDASSRQPKITVTYRIRNAEKDYPKGTVTFTVPGIGYAHRGSVVRSDKLSSDQTDSEWNCVWNSQTDLYTFTNNFDVKTGQSPADLNYYGPLTQGNARADTRERKARLLLLKMQAASLWNP